MKKRIFPLLRYITASLLCFSLITVSYAQGGFSDATQVRLQHVLDSFINQSSPAFVGGMSVAINVDGLAVWEGAGGYASTLMDEHFNMYPAGLPFHTSTPSRIYSITKTFTASLVLQLAHQGYFKLDDPIGKYLDSMEYYNKDLDRTVTIRQLLNHESGYQDWEDNMGLLMAVFGAPYKVWTPYELMRFTEQLTPPGTRREYSHNNYVFLGAIIEKATKQKVEDLYRDRFFTPLGLQSIYLEGRESRGLRPEFAAPHDNILGLFGGGMFPQGYLNISFLPFDAITSLGFTGGGLVATAYDISVWCNALYGGRITTSPVLHSTLKSISDTVDPYGNKLGYGIKLIDKISGEFDFYGHNGSAPGYRSSMFYQPSRQMTIVVLSNFAGVDPYVVSQKLYEALPEFLAGNDSRQEDKIVLCYKGKAVMEARHRAELLIKDGATLGACEGSTEVEKGIVKPTDLLKTYPNPASGNVTLSFTPARSGQAILTLHNNNGTQVATLYNGTVEKGMLKQVTLSLGKFIPGTYYCRLQTTNGVSEQKLFIVR